MTIRNDTTTTKPAQPITNQRDATIINERAAQHLDGSERQVSGAYCGFCAFLGCTPI